MMENILAYDPFLQTPEDLSTYMGRLRYFQKIITPAQFNKNKIILISNLFYSNDTIRNYDQVLSNHKNNKDGYTNEQLWKMRYIVDSSVHPQTKEIIPLPFRTSSFVPTNVPILIILSVLPPTFVNQIIGQTVNQTYNFLFNYCNRNASNVYSNEQLGMSYVGAVFFALLGSLGGIKLLTKMNAPSPLLRIAPICGVIMANSFNLFFTRTQDIYYGIDLYDSQTNQPLQQKSKNAGQLAFLYTLGVRTMTSMILFGLPPIFYSIIASKAFYQKRLNRTIVDIAFPSILLYCGLSVSLALYPQYIQMNPNLLEPEFHNLKNQENQPITSIYFNKGL